MHQLTTSEIDQLGERLRAGLVGADELILLSQFRNEFLPAYETVVSVLRGAKHAVSGRPSKSTSSVIAKLNRESSRLAQVQDISGCRVLVPNQGTQNFVANRLSEEFVKCKVHDRRTRWSHGYRAVHVVAFVKGRPIEVQIRTFLQHSWAELSEKFSDRINPAIKYGGGNTELVLILQNLSKAISRIESLQHDRDTLRNSMFESGARKDSGVDRDVRSVNKRLKEEVARFGRILDDSTRRFGDF